MRACTVAAVPAAGDVATLEKTAIMCNSFFDSDGRM